VPVDFSEYIEALVQLGDHKPCQAFMVLDGNGRLLVDSLGSFSDIKPYFASVCDHLRILPAALPHKNVNSRVYDTDDPLTQRQMSLIENNWALDYHLWSLVRSRVSCDSLRANGVEFSIPHINLARYDPWGYSKTS
jgi:hypothetical protein